jgi:hypothetical protein
MTELSENYCNICDKSYKNKKSLINHKYKYHNNKEYKCEKCNKEFNNYQCKYRHVKKCKGKERITIISTLTDEEIEEVISLEGDELQEKMLQVIILDKTRKFKDIIITDITFDDVYYFDKDNKVNQLKKINDDILSDYMLFTSNFDTQSIWDININYINELMDNIVDKYLDNLNNDVSIFNENKYIIVFLNINWDMYNKYLTLI